MQMPAGRAWIRQAFAAREKVEGPRVSQQGRRVKTH